MYMFLNAVTHSCTIISFYIYMFCATYRVNPIVYLLNPKTETHELVFVTDVLSLELCQMIAAFECIFLFKMCINCVTTYTDPQDSQKKIKNNRKIFNNYLKTTFIFDFLAILPLTIIHFKRNRECLFFLLKLLRLIDSYEKLTEVQNLMKIFRIINHKLWLIDPCDCREEDHNKIELFHVTSYLLKIIIMMINIFNFTYLIGAIWWIITESIEDFYYDAVYGKLTDEQLKNQGLKSQFQVFYGLIYKDRTYNLISQIYFSFTTMSTVGFGDYAPRSNIERVIGSFLLLLGVAIFSYILGSFQNLIVHFQALIKDNTDNSGLELFFQVLKKYNRNRDLPQDIIDQYSEFFNLKWVYDKNQGFSDEYEAMLRELPTSVL